MDNRNDRKNYTLKIFDRAYEKIGEGGKCGDGHDTA